MSRPSLPEYSAKNVLKLCSVTGCGKHRRDISRFCNTHTRSNKLFGNPYGHALRVWEYAQETKEVTEIINQNLENPAIQAALETFDTWLKEGARGVHVLHKTK